MTDIAVVFVTGPNHAQLEAMSRALLEERLIACSNILDGVTSIYRWHDEIEASDECLAILKTPRSAIPRLRSRVEELHPYDVPEFLVLGVEAGSERYLEWVRSSTGPG